MPQEDEFERSLTPADRELGAALRGLRPAGVEDLDPVACAFAAGVASARPSLWRWRAAAAAFAVAAGVSFLVTPQAGKDDVGRFAVAPDLLVTPANVVTERASTGRPYIHLRERVLDEGLDALHVSTYSPPDETEDPILRAAGGIRRPS